MAQVIALLCGAVLEHLDGNSFTHASIQLHSRYHFMRFRKYLTQKVLVPTIYQESENQSGSLSLHFLLPLLRH